MSAASYEGKWDRSMVGPNVGHSRDGVQIPSGGAVERQLRYLVGAVIVAAIASVALVFFGADPIDLEAVIPWSPNPTVGTQGQGLAIAILVGLPLIAALPLFCRGVWRRRITVLSSAMVSVFVVVSFVRVGMLYVPSLWMLGLAARIRIDGQPWPPEIDSSVAETSTSPSAQ
jgi:hypothetical protein